MRTLVKSIALAAVAWVFSSCATQVYLSKWEPSQVDLPRGTLLHVDVEARGPLRHELQRAFAQQIAADGYYSLHGNGPCTHLRLHHVHVNMVEPARDDKHRKRAYPNRVELRADVISNYQRIYRREVSEYVSCDYEYRPDWEEVAEDIAAEVMSELTPHLRRYSMGVDAVEDNPAVEQAALACAAGNWEQGRVLAQAALQQNPAEAEACYLLGIIERNARNYSASDSWFRKAHSLKPESKYASALRGNAQLQQDERRAHAQLNGNAG